MLFEQRLHKAKSQIEPEAAYLISDPLDIFYLTNFLCLTPEEREAFLFLTHQSAILFLSSFSASVDIPGLQTCTGGIEKIITQELPQVLQSQKITVVTIDGNATRVNEYQFFKKLLSRSVRLQIAKRSPVANERIVKDVEEVELLRKANALTHRALKKTFARLKVGMTEIDVQDFFENELRKLGIKQFSFPTIVCFGDHSALPHHQPTERKLIKNQAVLIDCGGKWQGYRADVTRTIWFGPHPSPEFKNIETVVNQAYTKVVQYITHRTPATVFTAAVLDQIARDHISAAGFGPEFIHTTGHGVGLYIHEQPSLNLRNETFLEPNMVITIEPGIYLDGQFGYRFENSVVITDTGLAELL